MDKDIRAIFTQQVGLLCCRRRVGFLKSLSIGFGKKILHHNPRLRDPYYGEFELGSYLTAWRFLLNGKIICGSSDLDETVETLDAKLGQLDLGAFQSISMLSEIDIRVELDNGVTIDFLPSAELDDEVFHAFFPANIYVNFSLADKWRKGQSQPKD